jgi:hypothetical protein
MATATRPVAKANRYPAAALGEQAVVSAARARSIGLYGIGSYRSDGAAAPA